MSRNKLAAAILFLNASAMAGPNAFAQGGTIPKMTPAVSTAPSAPAAGVTRTLSTSYNGSWNGLSALNVTVSTTLSPQGYASKANITPSGLTAVTSHLKKSTTYAAQSRGALTASGRVQPAQYIHQGGKKGRRVEVDYSPGDVKVTVAPDFGTYGDPPANQQQKLESTDTLSAIVSLVNSSSVDVCKQTLKIFDGKARYNLTLTPIGNEKVRTDAFKGTAQKCRADYKRIAGYGKPGEKEEKPLFSKPFTIWFAPAQNGLMAAVKVTIDSNWGPINLNLASWSATTS